MKKSNMVEHSRHGMHRAIRRASRPMVIVPILFFLSAPATTAQISAPTPDPVATAPAAQAETPTSVIIPARPLQRLVAGTEVSVRLLRELTTKDKALHVGDRFDLETVDNLKLGGANVIPAGTRVVGEITSVRNKGMWGKSGHFTARLLYLRLGDRQIRITGQFDDKGTAGGWVAAGTSILVIPILGFFMTGTSAKVPAGAIIKAYLDEDVPVAFTASPEPQPIIVAPAPTTPAP